MVQGRRGADAAAFAAAAVAEVDGRGLIMRVRLRRG